MSYVNEVLARLQKKFPHQPEFLQAVTEVFESLEPLFKKEKKYQKYNILSRIVIPERQVNFRVTWINDKGEIQVNQGYRIQYNSAIGPYKGGLRFHPSVSEGTIKFLGFEQIFKNSLTGLAMGGGKGGSDFDPKGKTETEIMHFCQAFMTELSRHIGARTDVPAGDIGVGGREIGYLFGQYKKLQNSFDGVLTGKALGWGGSLVRPEATGYGNVYFAEEMLKEKKESLEGKICLVSGSGNVAIYTVEKLQQLGAKPVTVSDSRGYIYDSEGIDLVLLKDIKEVRRESLVEYAKERKNAKYTPVSEYPNDHNPLWNTPCFAAFPSATQNEINLKDAENLLKNGCKCVSEGANMPSSLDAAHKFLNAKICYGPAKAANAGGVATSGLEMSQNAAMISWTFEEVDKKLHGIMKHIYAISKETAKEFGEADNLVLGSNIAGFRKVADAMIEQGI
ncbi:glutamate dehydrogenase [Helicobacter monodelphidis]|uniref:NADP-specific glutamate dehydrogenase n=1 Tax=Helicobacter sp. 15-1451 TaxID=2004995 RepID=UPI000DCC16A9|nr:NADP-specific glutamate dehydrogenase [Helicobacter sp. 15-1451]RAX57532.1 glutamate dehydrogenase [Helicobacter sp. 15-1451]